MSMFDDPGLPKFDVTEEFVVGDLSDVKEERDLLPPTQDVDFIIKKAHTKANPDNTYRQISLQVNIENGIQVGDELKWKNKPMFVDVCYYADDTKYTKDFFKKKQHLVLLTQLCSALGEDLKSVRLNDAFLGSLHGRRIKANIVQRMKRFTAKDGTKVENMQNEVKGFKKAEINV